jgi:hypothetical protein
MPLNSRSRREADLGLKADVLLDGIGLDVGGARVVSFLVARRLAHRGKDRAAQWKAYRRQMSSGLLAVMRLDAANREIEDYVLLPAPLRSGRYVWLSSDSLRRRQGALYEEKVRCHQGKAGKNQPCRPNQLSTVEKAIEIRPAQSQGLRRAALTVRRYKTAPMSVP